MEILKIINLLFFLLLVFFLIFLVFYYNPKGIACLTNPEAQIIEKYTISPNTTVLCQCSIYDEKPYQTVHWSEHQTKRFKY